MKGKFAFALCATVLALSVSAFAEDECLYFGANYSYMYGGGYGSHAVGGHVSTITDRVYAALGFLADVSGDRDFEMKELRELGVRNIETKFFTVPIRIGYPFMIGSDTATFTIILSVSADAQFFGVTFDQKNDSYKMSYKMSGFGTTFGAALNLGMQHKIGKAKLMYGVDMDFGLLSVAVYRFDYSGYVPKHVVGSGTGSSFSTVADGLQFAASPYISVGFSL